VITPPVDIPVLDLHLHRRALRAERARVSWWRRLVRARMDLAVAQAAGPQPLGETVAFELPLDVSLDVPPATQLGSLLATPGSAGDVGRLPELRALDERLARYEAGVDDAIERATARLVECLTHEVVTPVRGVQGPVDRS
jgi:hypothetical protein